jgi:uncharacterized protein
MGSLPDLSISAWILLVLAAIGGGSANALVGGGMFFVFPALLFAGIPPVAANATATCVLVPGGWSSAWIYRDTLKYGWKFQSLMALVSLGGAWLGSELLLNTSEQGFARLVPYLMLAATLIFTFSAKLRSAAASHAAKATHYVPLIGGQFLIAVYGGYFGAGMGVLMLALYLVTAHMDMHQASGIRLICGGASNTMAAIVFVTRGIVRWPLVIPMLIGCVAGGYFGAKLVRKMDPGKARTAILAFAWILTAWLLIRSWM